MSHSSPFKGRSFSLGCFAASYILSFSYILILVSPAAYRSNLKMEAASSFENKYFRPDYTPSHSIYLNLNILNALFCSSLPTNLHSPRRIGRLHYWTQRTWATQCSMWWWVLHEFQSPRNCSQAVRLRGSNIITRDTRRVNVAVMLSACIREAVSSNLGWDTGWVSPGKFRDITSTALQSRSDSVVKKSTLVITELYSITKPNFMRTAIINN
jgi:hypothetical protein